MMRRLGDLSPAIWLGAGCAVVAAFALVSAWTNSVVVDDVRYFWLDDDQMIAMRYARNLAEGHGLVWNPGERVEGYSNFLWTLVMAGVHLLPVHDAHASLLVRLFGGVLACSIVVLAVRLLRLLGGGRGLQVAAVVLTVTLSHELLFWALHGFETTLLTALFLAALCAVLHDADRGALRWRTCLLIGALPLVRTDGHHLWIAAGLLVLGTLADRRAVWTRLPLAALLPAGHLLFRRLYYGEWLPNTYYLKVSGQPLAERLHRGLDYVTYFTIFYWLVLLMAVVGSLVAVDRRRRLLLAGVAVSLAYSIYVGGDIFFGARFLAPQAPVLVVLAMLGVRELCGDNRRSEATMLAATAGSYLAVAAFIAYMGSGYTLVGNPNGGPRESVITGVTIRNNSTPEARVAVHAAGIVPYFSRRHSLDMLGKTDPHVARSRSRGSFVGHDKIDVEHSLLQERADLAVMLWLPRGRGSCTEADRAAVAATAPEWVATIYHDPAFQGQFCGSTVEFPGASPIYVRHSSPERNRLRSWRLAPVAP